MSKNHTTAKIWPDYSFLKRYGEKYKLVTMDYYRPAGYEENCLYESDKSDESDENKNYEKLAQSISRARQKIFEYAICNDFDFFVTLTLDESKIKRDDIDNYIKKLGQYIRNLRRTGQNIEYLLIPEKHRDGQNWHMHGLMKGISDLRIFDVDEHIPFKMKDKILRYREQNLDLYEWVGYAEKFGFNCIEPVRNLEACSKYVTKYVSKEIGKGINVKNKKMYYASRGLKRAELIKKGMIINKADIVYDYVAEHCKIKWLTEDQAKEIEKLFYC